MRVKIPGVYSPKEKFTQSGIYSLKKNLIRVLLNVHLTIVLLTIEISAKQEGEGEFIFFVLFPSFFGKQIN